MSSLRSVTPSMDSPPNSPRMDKEFPRPMMDKILNLSLKIIYLLTGEDYGPQRKSWEEFAGSGHSCASRRLRSPWSPVNELKILKLTNMITELLTGEVSVRWHSVAVYFSMEEWEYLEEHKDLYKDIMENHQTITLLDITETAETPERSTPFSEFLTDDDRNVQTVQSRTDEAAMIKSLENVIEDPEESCITNSNMYTPTHHLEKYLSHHTKGKLFPGEQVILMNADISSPTHQIPQQDPSLNIKEESLSCDVETFSDSDAYSPIGQVQYSPPGNKEDLALCEYACIPASRAQTVTNPQECSECDMCFTSMIAFLEHQLIHTKEKSYICPECKKSFANDSEFILHLRFHQGDKKFACAECGKSFKRRTHLSMHEKIHTGERPYSCKECGKCFIRHSYFIIHQRIHTGEKPYSCSECHKCFTSKPELVSHQRIHTGEKPFLCIECGKCFNSNKSLYRHRMSHTGERPFPCAQCGKSFTSRRNLNAHLRSHTGEKPFSCDQCGKFFTCKRNLQAHQRLHTGEKPFCCAACRMRFTNKPQLVRHQQAHIHHTTSVLKEDILMTVVDDQ